MATEADLEYNRALDFIQNGDLNQALTAVESALTSDSQIGDYWSLYAALLQQLNRPEDAAKALKNIQSLQLETDEVSALLLKANKAATEAKWNRAITACEEAIELDPERTEIWASYTIYLLAGNYLPDSLDTSLKLITLEKEEPQYWYLRGRSLRLNGKSDEAEPAYCKALELNPQLALAWYEKGMIHHAKNDLTTAKECFLQAKNLNLPDPAVDEALRIIEAS